MPYFILNDIKIVLLYRNAYLTKSFASCGHMTLTIFCEGNRSLEYTQNNETLDLCRLMLMPQQDILCITIDELFFVNGMVLWNLLTS